MIPADIDLPDIADDLAGDGVSIGSLDGEYPGLADALSGVVEGARESGFGELRFVFLDSAPAVAADQRDIAQDLMDMSGAETLILRSPAGGAVVSDNHSRAAIESAQVHMFANPDLVAGTEMFIGDLDHVTVPWQGLNLGVGATVLVAVLVTVAALRRRTR
ncbi:DUF6676 family protein [Corynebacterium pygosceleis]|uniref:1-deoxy-D-xylulose-5-phosphate synthase n=1 Tax=Corynebacterium pygosceleis TaxID=2800406 RepID=A0A9Q4C7Z6_9CORY|nr:DUF6676 family protein [Corynebacterium pygosceleis]MCK7637020.1 hypothetical protein [Corynebacterium pygosceleis]MCK7674494.1 hypothetical protein [Corynebacterium pygosceleis]MCL0120208.1 hypothetical protein [Corynebacterium pygosceleis]MCX7467773.1 hypothetical protein [Corynebacterium pygosceleis]